MNLHESTHQFPTSRTLVIFSEPLHSSEIIFKEEPIRFSQSILKHLAGHWKLQLQSKQQDLTELGISSIIKSFSANIKVPLDALFVNDKPVMWPGQCITLRDWQIEDHSAKLLVNEISYPFIAALGDIEFVKRISKENLPALRPPLAICTFAITTDNFLVLTVRGNATPVYPGRFYGQGGNPDSSKINILHHQLEEMKEEILIESNEVIAESMKFFGIIEDEETFPGKPDLIGTVKVFLSSKEVKKRFDSRSLEARPADVSDIRFIQFDKESLFHFLKNETQPKDFCPPAYGGLMLVGLFQFGNEWLKESVTI